MRLCVLGGVNWDVVANVADLPRRGETVTSLSLDQSAGGKGLNGAVAAARFGADTCLLGAVGVDGPAETLRDFMAQAGVGLEGLVACPDLPTGQALIFLALSGDNVIVVNAGANRAYGAAQTAAADLTGAGVFLTQFEAEADAIEALFARPEAKAGIKILNAAPALIEHRRLLDAADIVIVNETELCSFAGLAEPPRQRDAVAAAARVLITRPGQRVIVTLGGDGCMAVDRETVLAVPAYAVRVIDTIGAGDCFCGVLAAALAEGCDIAGALRWASAAAALSVGRKGAAASSPLRAEVEAFLKEPNALPAA